MKKNIFVSVILLFAVLFLSGCNAPGKLLPTNSSLNDASAKVKVVASFYPLAYFSQKIGGDRVEVISVVPAGTEPHDYEPTPQDIRKIQTADVVVYLGAGLDPWADKLKPELIQKGIKVLQFSDGLSLLEGGEEDHESNENQVGEEHEHGAFDPHVWLDPVLVSQQVPKLIGILISKDPQHRSTYEKNAHDFTASLEELDRSYQKGLANCSLHSIITSHAAAGYLAQRYGFEQQSLSGLSPDSEASPRQITELAKLARQKAIKYIFFETLVSPKVAETLAAEIGATTLVFNPLEGLTDDDTAQGKDYMSIMRDNLQNLKTAMDCK